MSSIKQKAAHGAALILFAITLLIPALNHSLNHEIANANAPAAVIACSGGSSQGSGGDCY